MPLSSGGGGLVVYWFMSRIRIANIAGIRHGSKDSCSYIYVWDDGAVWLVIVVIVLCLYFLDFAI